MVVFEQIPLEFMDRFKEFKNLNMVQGDISNDFVEAITNSSDVITFATINKTDAELYKQVKQMIKEMNKNILKEVLV